MTYPPCILTHNPLAFKLAFYEEQIYKCLFGNIKNDATTFKIELSSVFFNGTFADFLSRWFTAFHWGPRKISCWSLQNIGHNFLLRVAHSLIGVKWFHSSILASFLAWISLSLTVVIPRPESSLSVKRSVKRSSVRKLKLSTAFSLFASANRDSELFSESSIEVLPLKLLE